MFDVPNFLNRLTRIDGYRALQGIFAEILSQADSGGEHAALARGIDEAIHRFESERSKDEQELKEFQSHYDSFLTQNQGVMGWFKRHLPFSATRRQERDHRENVAGQAAEILADNLVIARAQMIKERILGSSDRKLGYRLDEWRAKLHVAASRAPLSPLAELLKGLSGEIERSKPFLAAIQEDVDAFAGASFKTAEDRKLRDADLATARQELAELNQEILEKIAMKKAGLAQLALRAAGELELEDAAFRADRRQVQELAPLLSQNLQAHSNLEKFMAMAATVGKLGKELRNLPSEMQQQRDAWKRLEILCADANAMLANKQTVFDGQRGRFEAAQREMQQTRQLLLSAQEFYAAHQEETRANQALAGQAEAGVDQPTDSPMLRKLNDAKASSESAQIRLREATVPYEAAKKEVEAAEAALKKQEKARDVVRDKVQALGERLPKLRGELAAALDRLQVSFSVAASALAAYVACERDRSAISYCPQELAAGMLGVLGPEGLERGLVDALGNVERDRHRFEQAQQVLERLTRWLENKRKDVEAQSAAAHKRRHLAWSRRCAELLGDILAKEACATELPP